MYSEHDRATFRPTCLQSQEDAIVLPQLLYNLLHFLVLTYWYVCGLPTISCFLTSFSISYPKYPHELQHLSWMLGSAPSFLLAHMSHRAFFPALQTWLLFISQDVLEKKGGGPFPKHSWNQEAKYLTVAVTADATFYPLSYVKVLNAPKLSVPCSCTSCHSKTQHLFPQAFLFHLW